MNKKATFFHWLLLGVVAAVAITLILVSKGLPGTLVKGEWQLDFLQNAYLAAEKEILRTEITSTNIGQEISFSMAQQGGFTSGEESPCGAVSGVNLWNKGAQSCFPDAIEAAKTLAQQRLRAELPQNTFSELGFQNGIFFGKGGIVQIRSADSVYSFHNDFTVSLNYFFEDYGILFADSQRMLSSCRDRIDLKTCLEESKPVYWRFGSCSQEFFSENIRKVLFCVQSPLGSKFSLGTEFAPILVDATYLLALDFTPSNPLSVRDVLAEWDKDAKGFTLSFNRDLLAQRYTLYYTNYPLPRGWSGTGNEFKQNIPSPDPLFFQDSIPFRDQDVVLDAAACTPEAVRYPSTPYLCGEEIIYFLIDENEHFKEPGEYVFAVTTSWGEKESRIERLYFIRI